MPSLRSLRLRPLGLVSWHAATPLLPLSTDKERTVIVEYPTLEKAIAAYSSAAYGEALKALSDGAVRDFRIVEGSD